MSEYVDVIAQLNDGTFINISNLASWVVEDVTIANASLGRIIAGNAGETTVKVQYNGLEAEICVKVLETVDLKQIIDSQNIDTISTKTLTASERQTIINLASGMVNCTWIAQQNLTGWKGEMIFTSGTRYYGIPYTQSINQIGLGAFNSLFPVSDFYASYSRSGVTMPKYGNDCSGFVSIAWGISRKTTADFVAGINNGTYKKVGTYDSSAPTTSALTTSYASLQPGDAVVKLGHTFIIASNSTSSKLVYAYEQTPYYAQYTVWSYNSLALGKYMPFTK